MRSWKRKHVSKSEIHKKMMNLGHMAGCHQMPERSFFYKSYQYPLCARCTGILAGYFVGTAILFFYCLPVLLCFLAAYIMFLDWFIQYKDIRVSTNRRRFITGLICGIGYLHFIVNIISGLFHLLITL